MFTQSQWRKKKNFIPEENLEKIKKDQEVFARARARAANNDIPSNELVVLDLLPIVHIGSTNRYISVIPEEIGRIPFRTKRQPGSEVALIADSTNEQNFINNSKILSINSYPTTSLTYAMVKRRLEQCKLLFILCFHIYYINLFYLTLKILSNSFNFIDYLIDFDF